MAYDLKSATPDTSIDGNAFLFGADSQSATNPSVYQVSTVTNYIVSLANTWTQNQTFSGGVNKVTITAPATGSTLTIADGKTLTANNTLTLAGTDSTTMTFPSTSGTVATLNTAQTFTQPQTISDSTSRTTSSPVIDAAQTWNNGGVVFSGIRLNVTNTASNSSSNLLDLQIGGQSIAAIKRIGLMTLYGNLSLGYVGMAAYRQPSDTQPLIAFSGDAANNNPSLRFGLGGGSLSDAFLRRRGTANFALGDVDAASPVAQTLSVQSVVAGTSNTAGQDFKIAGSQGTGTGAGGSIIFQVAPAGSSGTAQNALVDALVLNSNRSGSIGGITFSAISATTSGHVDVAGVSRITGANNARLIIGESGNASITTNNIVRLFVAFSTGDIIVNTATAYFGYSDAMFYRDDANKLALRNGNNGQTFRLYGRFTDITNNFERFFINAPTTSGDAVQLGTQKGATTGAARALEFQTDGTTRLTIASTSGNVTTTGSVTTAAPAGGTAAAWKLGTVATVSPTSPNRTIEVDIGGTIYYISAKTTND